MCCWLCPIIGRCPGWIAAGGGVPVAYRQVVSTGLELWLVGLVLWVLPLSQVWFKGLDYCRCCPSPWFICGVVGKGILQAPCVELGASLNEFWALSVKASVVAFTVSTHECVEVSPTFVGHMSHCASGTSGFIRGAVLAFMAKELALKAADRLPSWLLGDHFSPKHIHTFAEDGVGGFGVFEVEPHSGHSLIFSPVFDWFDPLCFEDRVG